MFCIDSQILVGIWQKKKICERVLYINKRMEEGLQ